MSHGGTPGAGCAGPCKGCLCWFSYRRYFELCFGEVRIRTDLQKSHGLQPSFPEAPKEADDGKNKADLALKPSLLRLLSQVSTGSMRGCCRLCCCCIALTIPPSTSSFPSTWTPSTSWFYMWPPQSLSGTSRPARRVFSSMVMGRGNAVFMPFIPPKREGRGLVLQGLQPQSALCSPQPEL